MLFWLIKYILKCLIYKQFLFQTDNMYYLPSKELSGSISQNQISDISSVSYCKFIFISRSFSYTIIFFTTIKLKLM